MAKNTLLSTMIALLGTRARIALAAGCLLALSVVVRADDAPPRVLVVLSYHIGMPWTDEVSRGLIEALKGTAEPVFTQLDVKRHPSSEFEDGLLQVVTARVAMTAPRAIIAIDDYAYQFVLKHRAQIGPDLPIVFGGVNFLDGPPPPGVTGVVESLDLTRTLDLMVALQPGARRWVIVNDDSETGRANRKALEQTLASRNPPDLLWLGSGTFSETERALAALDPRHDAVLLLSWNLDSAGRTRSYEAAARLADLYSPAPLYGVWGFYFGQGIVGGALLDGRVHGREIGTLVQRVIDGEAPEAIPVVHYCRTTLHVDMRELERFGLSADAVPAGAELAFARIDIWTQHGPTVAAVLIILALQTATISWLLILRRHRKQALARLRDREADLRLALDRLETAQHQAQIGSWELDATREHVTLSREMYRLLGLAPGSQPPPRTEILGLLHPEDRAGVDQAMARVESSGVPTTIEVRSDPARGPARVYRATLQTRTDPATGLQFLSGTLQDITAEAEAEAVAQESQERMRLALQGADLGIWDWHLPSGEVSFNDRCVTMAGYSRDQVAPEPRRWNTLLHPDDLPRVQAVVRDYLARTIAEHEIEFRIRHAAGSWAWVLSKGKVIARSADGAPLRAAGTHLDITDRKQREETLRSTERKLAEIFRASPEVIALTRASDGRFLEINDAFTQVFGHSHHEVVGHTSVELALWPSPEDRAEFLRRMTAQGELRNIEIAFRSKSGRLVPFLTSVTRIALEGEPCLVWLLTDITERKQAELERTKLQEQLLHAMKMEAVGRLAGGVAHDFNNLLTVITGNVELMRCDLDPADPHAASLADIAMAASSAAGLTRQLLAFSRRQIIEPRVLDLNELIGGIHKMLPRLIGEDIALELSLAGELGAVKVDPGQFEQVVINLTVNARDAMPDGGCLTISTANTELDAAACARHPHVAPGRFVRLAVSDTGHGMSDEVKQRLFEPFFTTKPLGRGTGLGLAMIFGAVKQAGGAIEVDSEVHRGTTMRLYLPRVDEPKEVLVHETQTGELPRGDETILLVEDDTGVRTLTSTILRRLGYRVLATGNGNAAIEEARTLTKPLDLLLTDLVMPGLSGRETAERVLEIHPGAAVLFASGHTEDTIVRQGIMTDLIAFIAKPYTLQSVATKVRGTLDARTGHPTRA